MGYVEQNLSDGETVLYKAKLHWGMFINPAIVLGIGIVLAIFSSLPLITPATQTISEYDPVFGTMSCIICCAGPFLFGGSIHLLGSILSFITTEFALTDQRIIAKTGVFRQRSLEIMNSKVESIGVNQPIIGRLLNYGTITVSGTGGTKQPFHNISDPMGLRQKINAQMIKSK